MGFSCTSHPFWGTPIYGNCQILTILSILDWRMNFTLPTGHFTKIGCTFLVASSQDHPLHAGAHQEGPFCWPNAQMLTQILINVYMMGFPHLWSSMLVYWRVIGVTTWMNFNEWPHCDVNGMILTEGEPPWILPKWPYFGYVEAGESSSFGEIHTAVPMYT